jgi:hypothetical protein
MQLKSFLSVALFGALALATPLASQQDVPTIQSGLKSVQANLQTFDEAIKGLNAGGDVAKQTTELLAKSKAIEDAMKKAITDIKASPGNIQTAQALQVQSQASALGNLVKATIDDLIAKKDVIQKANQVGTVKASLTSQKLASDDLVGAIVAQLPPALQSVAKTLSAGISRDLERGANAFV